MLGVSAPSRPQVAQVRHVPASWDVATCHGRAEAPVAGSMVPVVAIATSLPQDCSRLVPQFPYLRRGVSGCSAESFELCGLGMLGKSLSLSGKPHQPFMA